MPERLQAGHHCSGAQHRGKAQRHNVGPMRLRRFYDVSNRRLRSQRQAVAALQCKQGFGHQQAKPVGLAWKTGQHDAWSAAALRWRNACNRVAQHTRHAFRIQVFFKHVKPALYPGLTHRCIERRNHQCDEVNQTNTQGRLTQQAPQLVCVVALNQLKVFAQSRRTGRCNLRGRCWRCQRLQCVCRQGHDVAWAMPGVDQPANGAQALNLVGRIQAVAAGIAVGLRKTITTFPNPERILGQAGFFFYCSN